MVIGAGSAGLAAADFAARLGASVALIERDRIGGDCTWTGCVPSKALLEAAGLAHHMRRADRFGLAPKDAPVDLGAVLARVHATLHRVHAFETPEVLAEKGVLVLHGPAQFIDPQTIGVNGQILQGRRFLLATGAEPVIPPIPGIQSVSYHTYETVFELEALPAHLLVIGGGPLGIELCQAFRRLGSAVTVFEQADRILPTADAEASKLVAEQLVEEGVLLVTGRPVEQVDAAIEGLVIRAGAECYQGDVLLVSAGRRPRVNGLRLDRAGVTYTKGGVTVDAALRTSNRRIYACGDVTGGPQFTHYAGWQGVIATRNALLPGTSHEHPAVPWAVFTDPEVAQVGPTEEEARVQLRSVRVERWPIERIDRAQTSGEQRGFLKLVADARGKLLGATIVGGPAAELANELALAINRGLRLADLARTIHVYPTHGFAIQQAATEATFNELTRGWRGSPLRRLVRVWPQ